MIENPKHRKAPPPPGQDPEPGQDNNRLRIVVIVVTAVYILAGVVWSILDYSTFNQWEGIFLFPILIVGGWVIWDYTKKYRS